MCECRQAQLVGLWSLLLVDGEGTREKEIIALVEGKRVLTDKITLFFSSKR